MTVVRSLRPIVVGLTLLGGTLVPVAPVTSTFATAPGAVLAPAMTRTVDQSDPLANDTTCAP